MEKVTYFQAMIEYYPPFCRFSRDRIEYSRVAFIKYGFLRQNVRRQYMVMLGDRFLGMG